MAKEIHIWKIIRINTSVFLGLFLLLEMGFKLFASDYQYYERTYAAKFPEKAILQLDTHWIEPHPKLGWVCQEREDLEFYRSDGFQVNYSINSDGFRNTFEFTAIPDEHQKKILLLGDSFLFGLFLPENKTINHQLQSTDYQTINLSIPGWGIDQMHDAFSIYKELLQPDWTILFYIDEDIDRTLEAFFWGASTKPAYCLNNGELELRPPRHGSLTTVEEWFVFNFQIINRIYRYLVFQKAQPLAEALFLNLKKATQNKLSLVRLPQKEQVLNGVASNYNLTGFFTKNELHFLDLEPVFEQFSKTKIKSFYLPNDNHPSAKGTRLISNEVQKTIFSGF